jgi:glycosyltransferase involved in cell wall biosynthesis
MIVSIIIPTYKRTKLLFTLLAQFTLSNKVDLFEIIIVNDNPNESFRNRMAEFNEFNLNIILLDNSENLGRHKSISKGLQHASGDYTMLFDDDDKIIIENFDELLKMIMQLKTNFIITPTNENCHVLHIHRSFINLYKYWKLIPKHSDSKELVETSELKRCFADVLTKDRRVPTQLIWLQSTSTITFVPIVICHKNYLHDGLSANIRTIKANNRDAMQELFRFIAYDWRAPIRWRVVYLTRFIIGKLGL